MLSELLATSDCLRLNSSVSFRGGRGLFLTLGNSVFNVSIVDVLISGILSVGWVVNLETFL